MTVFELFIRGLTNCIVHLPRRLWNSTNPSSLVTVIAASNEPWAIDNTFLRSGRMSVCLYVGTLDPEGRNEFLRQRLVEVLSSVLVRRDTIFPAEINGVTQIVGDNNDRCVEFYS